MLNYYFEQQFKRQNRKGGGVLIELHPPSKFEGLPCKGNIDSFSRLFTFFPFNF
jgi:hypothetical protein